MTALESPSSSPVPSESFRQSRQTCFDDELCPGCGDAVEQHEQDSGCLEIGRSKEAFCVCLLSQADIAAIFDRWHEQGLVDDSPGPGDFVQ